MRVDMFRGDVWRAARTVGERDEGSFGISRGFELFAVEGFVTCHLR